MESLPHTDLLTELGNIFQAVAEDFEPMTQETKGQLFEVFIPFTFSHFSARTELLARIARRMYCAVRCSTALDFQYCGDRVTYRYQVIMPC